MYIDLPLPDNCVTPPHTSDIYTKYYNGRVYGYNAYIIYNNVDSGERNYLCVYSRPPNWVSYTRINNITPIMINIEQLLYTDMEITKNDKLYII